MRDRDGCYGENITPGVSEDASENYTPRKFGLSWLERARLDRNFQRIRVALSRIPPEHSKDVQDLIKLLKEHDSRGARKLLEDLLQEQPVPREYPKLVE